MSSKSTGRWSYLSHVSASSVDFDSVNQPNPIRTGPVGGGPSTIEEGARETDSFLNNSIRKSTIGHGQTAFDTEQSVVEGYRLIENGVQAEKQERYGTAGQMFVAGCELLASAVDHESDLHVRELLKYKTNEVLGWADRIAIWLEQGQPGGIPPVRFGQPVQLPVESSQVCQIPVSQTKKEPMEASYTLRYTPVSTKQVENFTNDQYCLRCLERGHRPTLMVVITMYNEDGKELHSTLRKVGNNLMHLKKHSLPGYDGDRSWQNIVVCIVSDGRKKANPSTLEYLSSIGMYNEDMLIINSLGTDAQMHLFERTIHLTSPDDKGTFRKFPPMQTIFAMKEHNNGKLDSHRWFFNAFAEQVRPKYTMLLDVGTMPTKSAFYKLLSAMEINPQIGGVCGEIAVDKPIRNLGNFVIAAQHFEYKVSHFLDKSLESCFGFISVLPGAFSAYRYSAIRGAPLDAYFKSLTSPVDVLGPFQGNMYLAEDRILAFELLARKDCNWTMHYVKDAIARTDVPTDLTALIGQRRRWLNGSFFAGIFNIVNFGRVYSESNHSYIRKLLMTFLYAYNVAITVFTWFLPAVFYLSVYFLLIGAFYRNGLWFDVREFPTEYQDLPMLGYNSFLAFGFVILLILGLGNKPKHLRMTYRVIAFIMGLITLGSIAVGIITIAGQVDPHYCPKEKLNGAEVFSGETSVPQNSIATRFFDPFVANITLRNSAFTAEGKTTLGDGDKIKILFNSQTKCQDSIIRKKATITNLAWKVPEKHYSWDYVDRFWEKCSGRNIETTNLSFDKRYMELVESYNPCRLNDEELSTRIFNSSDGKFEQFETTLKTLKSPMEIVCTNNARQIQDSRGEPTDVPLFNGGTFLNPSPCTISNWGNATIERYNGLTLIEVLIIISVVGVFFIGGALHCEVHHIFFTIIQYFLLLPTYIFILQVYSFSNLNDLSWGTKGLESGGGHGTKANANDSNKTGNYKEVVARLHEEEKRLKEEEKRADVAKRRFESFRSNILITWLACNLALVIFCMRYLQYDYKPFFTVVLLFTACINVIRLLGSLGHLLYISRQRLLLGLTVGCYKHRQKKRKGMQTYASADTPSSSTRTSVHQLESHSGSLQSHVSQKNSGSSNYADRIV